MSGLKRDAVGSLNFSGNVEFSLTALLNVVVPAGGGGKTGGRAAAASLGESLASRPKNGSNE